MDDLNLEMSFMMYDEGRIYYRIGPDNMVKIPYNANGLKMNQDEWDIYCHASDEDKELLAHCFDLDENKWLYMEYIKSCDFDWDSYKNGDFVNCLKFDYSQEKNIKFDCDFDCANCMFNFHFLKEQDLEKLKTMPYTYRWLVGHNKDLKCKFYAYTDIEMSDEVFLFSENYLDYFDSYLGEMEYDILFSDWIKKQKRVPKFSAQIQGNFVSLANRTRRRMMVKKHKNS